MEGRRSAASRTCMGLLFLAWLACFSLAARDVWRQTAYEPFLLSADPGGGYPRFLAVKGTAEPTTHLPAAGDRLVSIGATDLRGAGPAVWIAASAGFRGPHPRIPVAFESAGRVSRTVVEAETYRRFWPRLIASLAYVGCAIFLIAWARPSPLVDAIAWADLAAGIFFACAFAGSVTESRMGVLAHVASLALAAPLALRAVLVFPHGRPPDSAAARWGPWAFSTLALFDSSRFYGAPFSHEVGSLGSALVGLAYVTIAVVVGARTYVRSGALERRQMRWVFLASYLVAVPFAIAMVLSALAPRFGGILAIWISAFGLLPIAVTIALLRSNLFDVDRLLGSATSYTILVVVVLAATLWAVPALADAVSDSTGIESNTSQLVLAFGLALGLVRLHGWLRPEIDRVFFADHFAFERGMQQLMSDLSDCEAPAELATLAGGRLADGLRLHSLTLFLESEDSLVPVFATAGSAPGPLPRGGALVVALHEAPRLLTDAGGGGSPFDRAILEALGARVVVPIWGWERIVGILALGPKQSGDVYTSTETTLLAAVADKIGSELKRFDQAARLEASHRLEQRLRRFVDPHLADRLDRDEEVDLGERELSILFSDLRNYTEYTQERALGEVYATVNRYARAVSEIVHRHGGTVVDFAGDGVMAVFGAPNDLPSKERAAVSAAVEIVETLSGLDVPTPGVGIATGRAYVATVHAGGQLHWTALGDTTNLASRLQALSREVRAWIVIDDATRLPAGDTALDFRPLGATPIRGRTTPVSVHVLPMDGPA